MRRYFFHSIFIAMKCINVISVLLLVFFSTQLSAQVTDRFDDGDLNNSPSWVGNTDSFTVLNNQLRLNATSAGRSYLATSSGLLANQEWQLFVRFDLSPSLQNNCRFYLVSSQSDLTSSLFGYYVQLGGSTGNTDTISLYRQDGVQRVRIIAGRPSTVSKAQNFVSLKVRRDSTGLWELMTDTTGGQSYFLEGMIRDSTYKSSLFSGVFCQYTITNRANFYFDDFYSGPYYTDTTSPFVDSFALLSNKQILLRFSEAVQPVNAQDPTNYILSAGVSPITAQLQSDQRTVILTFSLAFVSGQNSTLVCDGIEDLAGNQMVLFNKQFNYFEPGFRDVVINELFTDPSPPVGLPNAEFVELYNRSGFNINLKNWQLTDGTTIATLPDFIIRPDSHLILCGVTSAADYSSLGSVLGVSSFPSLNNTGDKISLISNTSTLIDEVAYTDIWYSDEIKRQGGWTLEQRNPSHPCSGMRNWASSIDPTGGTPGRRNSVFSNVQDDQPPLLLSKGYISDKQIIYLVFDEQIDSVSFITSQISVSNGLVISGKVLKGDSVLINLPVALSPGVTYVFFISGFKDCWGNELNNFQVNFTYIVPVKPMIYGVLITELMCDETPVAGLPDAEYIELYNRSSQPVDLEGWSISDPFNTAKIPPYVLDSGAYVILCATSSVAKFAGFSNVLGISSFPSLSNDGELLVLRDEEGKVIHYVNYSSAWHSNQLKKEGGWSLEMSDLNAYCTGQGNWKSSIHPSGGTPGSTNSVHGTFNDRIKPEVINAYLEDSIHLVVQFSESLDQSSLMPASSFRILPSISGAEIHSLSPDFTELKILFSSPVLQGQVYSILFDSMYDCAGNPMHDKRNKIRFAVASKPDSGDIIINELLFNPRSGGYDYVELFNRSERVLDLSRLMVADADDENNIDNFYRIDDKPVLLFGGEYIVLTESAANISESYLCYFPERIRTVKVLPSMPDDEGVLLLIDSAGKRYDQIRYADDWHHPQVDNKEGVSLERIQPASSTQDRNNWISASSTSGFGTPGYRNSQYNVFADTDKRLFIEKDVFSPDGDGYADELVVQYTMDKPGYSCSFEVYTSQGRVVKRVINNELLGTSGIIKWRGEQEDGAIVQPGIYVLLFKLQHPDGNSSVVKKTCVLATK
jgi:hypothetical protein